MQHLGKLYGEDWMTTVAVGYSSALNNCCITNTSSNCNYAFSSCNCNLVTFFNFPRQHGFEVGDKYRLFESRSQGNCPNLDLSAFLQAWLFFALIHCVLRDEKGPLLSRDELLCCSSEKLNTGKLPKALGKWRNYIMHEIDKSTAASKLSEANQMLALAKQVVLANLAEPIPELLLPELPQPNGNLDQAFGPNDEQAICIMVLGETLSAVAKILMQACQLGASGWEGQDERGWGPPAYVSTKMLNTRWCPRSQAVVKGQLGRNATLLYVTTLAHKDNFHNCHREPTTCKSSNCVFIEAKSKDSTYSSLHSPNCNRTDCPPVGPNEEAVLAILEQNTDPSKVTFPLMTIYADESTRKLKVKVEEWHEDLPFATISHVWSHGLGNETEATIRECQLRAIQNLLAEVFKTEGPGPHRFWLDTFAVPQKRKNDPRRTILKRTAIRLIHNVFKSAKHCIVIDRYLARDGRCFHSCISVGAMLLASGWVSRLWTLQEAFVSRQLHLTLRDNEQRQFPRDLNNLWLNQRDQGKNQTLFESMSEMMERNVDQALINVGSGTPVNERSTAELALLIASVWRAVRYRTTGNAAEETLALSSLLGIPIPQENVNGMLSSLSEEDLEPLMQRFWTAIGSDDIFKKSIPPGIIFLPGKRLSCQGYRWAPATWMSGQVEGYPYPMETPRYPTKLTEQGLAVHYPGFLLHPKKKKLCDIISTLNGRNAFDLGVIGGIGEWYKIVSERNRGQYGDVTPPIVEDQQTMYIVQDLMKRLELDPPPKLGIIISRPLPVEGEDEVGLLVEVYEEKAYDFDKDHPVMRGSMLCCRIIRRIGISRLSRSELEGSKHRADDQIEHQPKSILGKYETFREDNVLGMKLDEIQSWCVDGFDCMPVLSREKTEAPSLRDQQIITENVKSIFHRPL
ncbi:hypothetical protein FAUST_7205 [Fusarium austroamericanum]|uniref:Heterokaryon incompatibility domain-containing protein n=1 Tax=Fusarium austroamericanum TaxID=282268 RepID=A0AAN6BYF5_FUSAU|nr:hypothetical protein FAUST_7205 [Fusarium austroamericanum]